MIKKTLFAIAVIFCFMNTQCEDDDIVEPQMGVCDEIIIANKAIFDNLVSDNFTFSKAEIVGDCLNFEIGASGCNGNTWEYKLVDSGAIAESLPEQRYLKFQLVNNEECLAVFTRTVSFDLTPLRINNNVNEIILNIDDLKPSLHYKY